MRLCLSVTMASTTTSAAWTLMVSFAGACGAAAGLGETPRKIPNTTMADNAEGRRSAITTSRALVSHNMSSLQFGGFLLASAIRRGFPRFALHLCHGTAQHPQATLESPRLLTILE